MTVCHCNFILCRSAFMLAFCSLLFQLRSLQDLQTVQIIKILRYEKKVAVMFLLMISCFLVCWTPYAVVSMMEAFGRKSMVSPTVAIIPSFFAKSSTAYNPLIYVFMSRKVCNQMNIYFFYVRKNYLSSTNLCCFSRISRHCTTKVRLLSRIHYIFLLGAGDCRLLCCMLIFFPLE